MLIFAFCRNDGQKAFKWHTFLSPGNGATGVFRAATECGCGSTKGSEFPLATEGKNEGGHTDFFFDHRLLGFTRMPCLQIFKENRENPTLEPDALAELLMLSALILLVNKFVQCTDIAHARQRSNKFVSALAYSQCSQTVLSLPPLTFSGNSVSFVEKPRPFGLKNRHVSVSITDNRITTTGS